MYKVTRNFKHILSAFVVAVFLFLGYGSDDTGTSTKPTPSRISQEQLEQQREQERLRKLEQERQMQKQKTAVFVLVVVLLIAAGAIWFGGKKVNPKVNAPSLEGVCRNCGYQTKEGDRFCKGCGTAVGENAL